jgi:hypothetical protein
MTPFETAARVAIRGGRERKRLGDGMFTPVRPIQYRDQWSRGIQTMLPGRDSVSSDWWGYKEHPELFLPVNRDDTRTVARHRETLERTRRHLERQLGRRGTTRATTRRPEKKFSLSGGGPRERWRLP